MTKSHPALQRALRFCDAHHLTLPVLLAPMAGVSPPDLSVAVMKAGGLGACGAAGMTPDAMRQWADNVRLRGGDQFQVNLWMPGPPPIRSAAQEQAMRDYLEQWGPPVPSEAGDFTTPDFFAQCAALVDIAPPVVSSIMGLYPPDIAAALRARGIRWFATATTVAEARQAERAGADAIIVQGMEAGGHRGSFDAAQAEAEMVGLFALLPAIVDATQIPVIASGGIADGRGVAAALVLGASAVQVGTAFLRCPEAGISSSWATAIGQCDPEGTRVTRAFSGRAARGLATDFVRAMALPDAPQHAPYPVQRGLTQPMRTAAAKSDDVQRQQAWSGQAGRMARAAPAKEVVQDLWGQAQTLLSTQY
ncbi:MAG: nitronate monooxygenase [Alphaproteobacteria bacterium]|nr:nitronate monooxygenase [Alphaproteobacteria bacterium]MBV8548762.1 nitronate monooxygenase [Alphaproteobacteria bacterium]